jgi:hypothetical protein
MWKNSSLESSAVGLRWLSNRVTATIQRSLYDPLMSCDSRLNEGTAGSKTQSMRLNESVVH